MFISYNKVRMHDTDMAGILYFAKQFRFVHDALEDLMDQEGITLDHLFHHSSFAFVVVHAEADYLKPVKVGDALEVHVEVIHLGTTSFSFAYKIFRKVDHLLIGKAKTVHVCLDTQTRSKITLPDELKNIFKKYQPIQQKT
ncbi:1,4-dihydroxy-2-naphthoyl-CoA hydrolase [Neochlamydia sp. TUME1]|uniref:acyl-CoA thioesterase n=1 Tax=Neochlamydia sp. TUME1 TaxID=1478174 RepID=UPI00057F011E|nr:thioesterase family protein [Neochlamydia sp. TUME1]KIC74233.1 1,4-dihydroxy-2-naphthoyl-CoA hydrolase [Neochlamydia sp. TUME1]